MKLKFKNIITLLAVVVCVCLLFGTGYTAAKYTGVFDAGSFFLSLFTGEVDPGQTYTLVYHTFDENGTDVIYKEEKIYENLSVTIEAAPETHSNLTFVGWSPQGSWIDEGENYIFTPDPSDQKNNVTLDSYVPEKRILHTASAKVFGKDLVFLQDETSNVIHLYDLYKEYYVKFDGTQTSVQWIRTDFKVLSDAELFARQYWGQNTLPATNGVITGMSFNLYQTTKIHYIHPALSYSVSSGGKVYNGEEGSNGERQYVATTSVYCDVNSDGVAEEVTSATYLMWDGPKTFILKATNADNPNYSSCFASGTLITIADGTKLPVEELKQGDLVRVYDHENGCYTSSPILFIEYDGDKEWSVINLEFSDGTAQKFIGVHALFDLDLNEYIYITEENYQDFIGHRFAKEENVGYSEVVLTNAYTQVEFTGCYGMTTEYHMNFFVNGMFSIEGGITGLFNFFEYDENLAYDKELMAEDIEKYGLFTYEDFADYMTEETFNTIFPVKYLKVSIGKGLTTFEGLEYIIERYIYRHGLDG